MLGSRVSKADYNLGLDFGYSLDVVSFQCLTFLHDVMAESYNL